MGGITLPDIKLYYKAIVIKTAWYWHRNRHIDQWDRTESPEINLCLYGQLVFDKGNKSIQCNKGSIFNKWCWENCTGMCRKMKLDHPLRPSTWINSEWIKILNVSHEAIRILEENIASKILSISHRNIFAGTSRMARDIKEKNKQMGLHQIKKFCTAKETMSKMER